MTILLLVGFAAYFPSLSGNFVFDDHEALINNPTVSGLQWSKLPVTNWYTYVRTFRPLTTAGFMLENALFGFNPFVFRLNNILLHVLSAFLLFLLARKYFSHTPAFLCALIFLLHPVLAENVNPVVGRAEILCTIFSLAVMLVLLKRPLMETGSTLLAAFFYLCAILAKENGITIIVPAAIVIWQLAMTGAASWKKFGARMFPFAMVAAGYLLYQVLVFGAFESPDVPVLDNQLHDLPRLQAWWAALGLQLNYLLHLTGFVGARADFTYPVTGIPAVWQGFVSALLLGAYLTMIWRVQKKKPEYLWMLLWYPATLSLASNMVMLAYCIFGPRFLHLPLVGIALLAGAGIQWTARDRNFGRISVVLVILIAFLWGGIIHLRSMDWQGDGTLFAADSLQGKSTLRVDVSLLMWLSERKMHDAAERQCAISLPRIDRATAAGLRWTKTDREFFANAYSLCGKVQLESGNPELALMRFRKASDIQPHGMFRFHSAQALENLGRLKEAASELRALLDEEGESDRPDNEIRKYQLRLRNLIRLKNEKPVGGEGDSLPSD